MSYYQGDYYQGDYYQGDPFLGALFGMGVTWLGKKLLGRGAKAAGTTAIARVGASAATGLVTGTAAGLAAPPLMAGLGSAIRTVGQSVFSRGVPANLTPGQPMFRTTVCGTAPEGCCPSGFHLNKSIGRGKQTMGMEPGTYCVRNRAMNVANPRALRRGLRRVVGFGKLAGRVRKSVKAAARAV